MNIKFAFKFILDIVSYGKIYVSRFFAVDIADDIV